MSKRNNKTRIWLVFMVLLAGMLLSINVYGQYYEDEEADGPGVFLYRHAGFRGPKIFVRAGRNIKDLKKKGWNDKISSVELVDNAYIRIYEHRNYQGASLKITGDVIDLVEVTKGIAGNWNDRITSIKVFHGRRSGWRDRDDEYDSYSDDYPHCIFYKHANGRGSSFKGDMGRHRKVKKRWNDEVSSVWVRRGYRVILYEHANYGGRRVVLEGKGWKEGSVFNLDRFGFNDAMSSYKLERMRGRIRRR